MMVVGLGVLGIVSAGCGEKEPPSRDHFMEIKQRLYLVQEAVLRRDRTKLDSLMSDESLSIHLDSDSLLSFVYGANNAFPFDRFGDYQILYTDKKARIDCFINDSTDRNSRPFILTFVLENKQWLLKRFEAGKSLPDST